MIFSPLPNYCFMILNHIVFDLMYLVDFPLWDGTENLELRNNDLNFQCQAVIPVW